MSQVIEKLTTSNFFHFFRIPVKSKMRRASSDVISPVPGSEPELSFGVDPDFGDQETRRQSETLDSYSVGQSTFYTTGKILN